MDLDGFSSFLAAKCTIRQVALEGVDDFFQPVMLAHVRTTWNQWLGRLVAELPAYETVIDDLRPQIEQLV
jgi:hypothetical protein